MSAPGTRAAVTYGLDIAPTGYHRVGDADIEQLRNVTRNISHRPPSRSVTANIARAAEGKP